MIDTRFACNELQAAYTDRNSLVEALNKTALVSITDMSGKITYVTDKFCELSGYSREELLGQNHRIINSGIHGKKFWSEMYRVALSGETWRAEVMNRAKDGSHYWVTSSTRVLLDSNHKPKGFVAVRVDITERQAQELELQRTNTELVRAKIDAEAANKAKSFFLANMSHEIRTPMTAILGHADIMLESDQNEHERVESAGVIHRNASHLMAILNDVLDLSKIEASELRLEEMPSDPVSIAKHVVSLLQPCAHDKELELAFDCGPLIPRQILTDPLRLRQILLNLVNNAIKFTEVGRITLGVAFDQQSGATPTLRFCVQDTGIGINADHIDRLFKPFSQADNSYSRKFGGTGLGLAISQHLAAALGGSIEVQSTRGQGSAFTLAIPAKSIDPLKVVIGAHCQEQPRRRKLKANPTLEGRILLVEDSPDNQRLIAHHLRRAGASVALADNGQIALDMHLAARGEFDLVLMDMQMPVMDGYEATRTLRNQGVTTPIVALTAHSMSGDRKQCIDAGCDDYLTKPIDRKTLIESCEHWINTARQRRAA